jgi:hypothetical protein
MNKKCSESDAHKIAISGEITLDKLRLFLHHQQVDGCSHLVRGVMGKDGISLLSALPTSCNTEDTEDTRKEK